MPLVICVFATGFAATATAEDPKSETALWPTMMIARGATIAPDLTFPKDAQTGTAGLERRMTLLKPEGDGPFPAIVMVHQCAGLNPAVMANAREAVAQNYVVLMIDSFGPRDVTTVCYGPQKGVNFFRGMRDALQAAEHLRGLPYVDKSARCARRLLMGRHGRPARVEPALRVRRAGEHWRLRGGREFLSRMFQNHAAERQAAL